MTDLLLTFAHICDTHIHVDPAYTGSHVDFSPASRTQALVNALNELPFHIDFVLHAGDVMHDPERADDYAVARDLFAPLNVPIYYLVGNHDFADRMQAGLVGRSADAVTPKYHQEFEVNGVQIICLDSAVHSRPYGEIGADQLAWLDALCSRADDTRPLVVATHHQVLPIGVPWFDTMATTDGAAVHASLLKAKHRLRGVFHGHIHQGLTTIRDGIAYHAAFSAWYQIYKWYGQESMVVDKDQTSGYNIVTLTTTDTFVRQYRLPMP